MLEIGRIIDGRWRIEAEIGEGGVARVFRVRHTRLDTLNALKVLKVHSADIAQRLAREGQVQAKLRHENVLEVTDVFDVDGAPGLLMRYIEGPPLNRWLANHQPPVAQAEMLFRGILSGVARAHSLGIIHRDLKPGNILLMSDGARLVPKVADFGLAKVLSEDQMRPDATRSGIAMGTPAYMAPEQFRGTRDVDQRADIFALGCILYELVCGQRPFGGNDMLGIHNAVAAGRYVPPEHRVPTLPWHLTKTIQASLEPNPDLRPDSCESLFTMLDDPARVWSPGIGLGLAAGGEGGNTLSPASEPRRLAASARAAAKFTSASTSPAPDPSLPSLEAPWSDVATPAGQAGTRAWPKRTVAVLGTALVLTAAPLAAWRMSLGEADTNVQTAVPEPSGTVDTGVSTASDAGPSPGVSSPEAPTAILATRVAPTTGALRKSATIAAAPSSVPAETTPRPGPPMATVRVGGDPAVVTLVDDAGVAWGPGPVPAGRYDVDASFGDETIKGVAEVILTEGQAITLTCRAKFARCTPR
jgi:serine/threonine protein kinase